MTVNFMTRFLPVLGYVLRPVASESAFRERLGAPQPYLHCSNGVATWLVPESEAEKYLGVAGTLTLNLDPHPISCGEGSGGERGGADAAGYREFALNLPDGEDGIMRFAEFLKSGLIRGIYADGNGCVIDETLAGICSPFRDDHDLARDLAELGRKNPEPTDALVANYIGKMRIEAGQTLEAAVCFRQAAQLNPDYAEPLANLGTLLWNTGRRSEALHLFAEALLRNPYDVDTQDNFIRAGFEAEEMVKMKSCLNLVRERFPDCRSLDYLNAVIAYRLGDIDGCRALVEGILQRDPSDTRARELLGELIGAAP